MDIKILVAVIGIAGSIVAAVLGYFIGRQNEILDYNKTLRLEAWKERNKQYKKLMGIMRALPKYPNRIGNVKYRELLDSSYRFKDWYFDGGGLFLTNDSRDGYFAVQKKITEEIFKEDFNENNTLLNGDISPEDYESVRKLMSNLRTELTNDLLSRKRKFS